MRQVILITGVSSGLGALPARSLCHAEHIVYASMRDTTGRNAPRVKAVEEYAAANRVDIRAIELDVASQRSADQAVGRTVAENERLDVVIHKTRASRKRCTRKATRSSSRGGAEVCWKR
jgi:NAD(P)-dependent dehydrogenase (short-subunit alcohol dehydrogenase family)